MLNSTWLVERLSTVPLQNRLDLIDCSLSIEWTNILPHLDPDHLPVFVKLHWPWPNPFIVQLSSMVGFREAAILGNIATPAQARRGNAINAINALSRMLRFFSFLSIGLCLLF
jgi:hypothetical protein